MIWISLLTLFCVNQCRYVIIIGIKIFVILESILFDAPLIKETSEQFREKPVNTVGYFVVGSKLCFFFIVFELCMIGFENAAEAAIEESNPKEGRPTYVMQPMQPVQPVAVHPNNGLLPAAVAPAPPQIEIVPQPRIINDRRYSTGRVSNPRYSISRRDTHIRRSAHTRTSGPSTTGNHQTKRVKLSEQPRRTSF